MLAARGARLPPARSLQPLVTLRRLATGTHGGRSGLISGKDSRRPPSVAPGSRGPPRGKFNARGKPAQYQGASIGQRRGAPPPPRSTSASRGPSPLAAKGTAAAAAQALTGLGSAKFLRAEEDEDMLEDEDFEDLDDRFEPDALPVGAAPTRGTPTFDSLEEEERLEAQIKAEEEAEHEEELDEAEELEKLSPEARTEARRQGAEFDSHSFRLIGATSDDVKRIQRIARGTEEATQDTKSPLGEENEDTDDLDLPPLGELPHIQRKNRQAMYEAIFQGYLKKLMPDDTARFTLDELAMRKLREEFDAKVKSGQITKDQMKRFADTEVSWYKEHFIKPAVAVASELNQSLMEMPIEKFYATEEEARNGGPVLSLGNKWVPASNYVRIKQQEFDAFFPEGVAGTLDKEWLLMNNRRNLMVREPAVRIAAALEKQRTSRFLSGPPAHFIRGGPGVGKSCVLSSVVYWARKNGWLVVWIPSGFSFVNDGNLQRSRREPLHFDQPEVAMPFLDRFGKGNAHIIGELPLRTSFTIGVPNVVFTSEGKTMQDLVNFAKGSFDYATDACFYLRQELNLVTEFPILVAIDDYNLFHDHAVNLYDPDFQKLNPLLINPEKLVLPSMFMSWQNHGLTNGTMLLGMTNTKPRDTNAFDARFPKLPSVFEVPRYSRDEFLTVVANYEQNGYIHTPATLETYRYVYHMCAGRGREIYKMLALY